VEPQVAIHELVKGGKYQDALLLAEKAFDGNPSLAMLSTYVELLAILSFYDRAVEVIESSAFSPATSLTVRTMLSDIYLRSGRHEEFEQLQQLDGGSFPVPDFVAVKGKEGSHHLALDSAYFCSQLADLSSRFGEHCPEFDETGLAIRQLVRSGQPDQAKTLLRRYADGLDDLNLQYFLRAEINLVSGEYVTAERRYRKLESRFPDPALVHNRLGDICLATGRRVEALQHYDRALRSRPDDVDTWRDLIRAHVLRGDLTAARKAYVQAVDLFGPEGVSDLKPFLEKNKGIRASSTVNGLAWFEGGGGVMPIEIRKSAGTGRLQPSGNLGLAMLDSMHLAHALATDRASERGVDSSSVDLLVNIPEGVIYKDGPSAGLALAVGMFATLTENSIGNSDAFTGEVSLSGEVHAVGGIPGKLGAAYFSGVGRVFIPAANLSELARVSPRIKSGVSVGVCRHLNEVLETLWTL
jgi:hypothetical protein